jgi:hypothetical protein
MLIERGVDVPEGVALLSVPFLPEFYLSELESMIRWFEDCCAISRKITDVEEIVISEASGCSKRQRIAIQISEQRRKLEMLLIAHPRNPSKNKNPILIHQGFHFFTQTRRKRLREIKASDLSRESRTHLSCLQCRCYRHNLLSLVEARSRQVQVNRELFITLSSVSVEELPTWRDRRGWRLFI